MNATQLVVVMLVAVPAIARGVEEAPLQAMPHEPSLDVDSMDTTVDPCVDFYTYACGGWRRKNPLPADEAHWSVYDKLEHENEQYLWGVLESAAAGKTARTPAEQKIGDYFAACMDLPAVEARGGRPLETQLRDIDALASTEGLPALLGRLQRSTGSSGFAFSFGSTQDWANSERVIGEISAGGLGLPDRDYYSKTDAKSVETRARYVEHIARMLALLGDDEAAAKTEAASIMKLETALAAASLTNVDKRDPHKLAHHADLGELQALMPSFAWASYLPAAGAPGLDFFNLTEPRFLAELERQVRSADVATWKAYLRWQLVHSRASELSSAFDDESRAFYEQYLRGVTAKPPRWKRCVGWVDRDLGEALGEAFVSRTFRPDTKRRTVEMTALVEGAMERELRTLAWMSEATRQAGLAKLHHIVNKVGYPDHWRDYSRVEIDPTDFAGDVERAGTFEWDRQLAKIGKPLDRGEWQMTAPTVDAYFDPQMNDINFPAGVLQAPLFDAELDDAPNYGDTGSTIGHELTHGFDDEGRQYDERGDLRDWWTPADAKAFKARAQCIVDQYGAYRVVDDIRINSKLTLGEDVADLGGTVLAYTAWKDATRGGTLAPRDGFTPEQRFFIGFGQWACANERPEDERLRALTDPHSPPRFRINGVVSNMPEFARAFACKKGAPMVRAKPCRVW